MFRDFLYTHKGLTKADDEEIIECIVENIDMTIDEQGRVWTEGGIYIADVEYIGEGMGIACQ